MMNRKGFTLIELLIVVAIIGILAAVGATVIPGLLTNAKINASKANHQAVVDFVQLNFAKCEIGGELILLQNPTTNTSDLCPYVLAGDANHMAIQLSYHFNSVGWCNPYGWKGGSKCAEAVETSGTIGEGTPGATKLLTLSNSPSTLIIDTKYTCAPAPVSELCRQGESLTNSIKLQ